MVATATAKPACVEGHACIVEAAVALATPGQGPTAAPATKPTGRAGSTAENGNAPAGEAGGSRAGTAGGVEEAEAEAEADTAGGEASHPPSVTPGAPSARAVAAAAAAARSTPSGATAVGTQEGITVHRFANRIPLLFEGGADVMTRTAHKDIKWVGQPLPPPPLHPLLCVGRSIR